jgi:choline kinase
MRILIVTVAGIASRFSQSIGKPVVKCLYSNNSIKECLLYRLLNHKVEFDKYIIVGGYKYYELVDSIKLGFSEFSDNILLVNNEHYEEYGSGYSLYVGLKRAIAEGADEIVFAEGDLFVDSESYVKLCSNDKSVISCNRESIEADKSVALYFDEGKNVHYIYDIGHKSFSINEPFCGIYNSGQIWKLSNKGKLNEVIESMAENDWKGTNLVFIEKYFQSLSRNEIDIIYFKQWINCNTVNDFNLIEKG